MLRLDMSYLSKGRHVHVTERSKGEIEINYSHLIQYEILEKLVTCILKIDRDSFSECHLLMGGADNN